MTLHLYAFCPSFTVEEIRRVNVAQFIRKSPLETSWKYKLVLVQLVEDVAKM